MAGSELAKGRPAFPPIHVPYKCAAVPYDGLGFTEFPQRSGWEILDRPRDNSNDRREAFVLRRIAGDNSDGCLDPSDRSIDEKAAFVQAWLFFGALTEALKTADVVIEVGDFLDEVDGVTVVSTARLHEYGQVWASKEEGLGSEGRGKRARRVYDIVREMEFFLSRWAPEGLYDRSSDGDDAQEASVHLWGEQRQSIHQIFFSAVVVSRFIRISAAQIFPDEARKTYLLVSSFGEYLLGWAYGRAENVRVTNFMVPNGQCRSEAQMLRERLFGAPKIFLYYLRRLSLLQDHRNCSRHQCKAQEVSSGSYQTRHTSPTCRCPTIRVDGAELARSLQNGKIPRVAIDLQCENSNSGNTIEEENPTITIAEDGPYVAISHVWCHGLGNDFENGLPRCQLSRLRTYVAMLGTTLGLSVVPHIWIDTLCIPVDPRLKGFRHLAIELLPRTFEEAHHVLVVDEELHSVSLTQSSMMELGLRILCSAWMRRLWTLAEGVQAIRFSATRGLDRFLETVRFDATRLSFQFLEASLSYSGLSQMSQKSGLDIHDHYCCHQLWTALEDRLPSFVRSEDFPLLSDRLFDMSVALKFRTTTRAMDEPVCIALLLGIPTVSITSLKTATERMRELYVLIREFPADIIFQSFNPPHRITVGGGGDTRGEGDQEGGDLGEEYDTKRNFSPNLDELPGFRWAPRSFLSALPGIRKTVFGKRATCDVAGLHGEYYSFIFDTDQSNDGKDGGSTHCKNPPLSTILSFPKLILRRKTSRIDSISGIGSCQSDDELEKRSSDRYIQLEWRKEWYDDEGLEKLLPRSTPSSSSPSPSHRGAILFEDNEPASCTAILGYVVGSDDQPFPATSVTSTAITIPTSKSTNTNKEGAPNRYGEDREPEVKFYPFAKGYRLLSVRRPNPDAAGWYLQPQAGVMIHGEYTGFWRRWCVV